MPPAIIGLTVADRKPVVSVNEAAGAGFAAVVYVGMRADGRQGSGTKEDPFDGSTADKFDLVLAGLGENVQVNILPGTYRTRGTAGWNLRTGWNLRGAGAGLTVLELDLSGLSPFPSSVSVIGHVDGWTVNYVSVSDLTARCRWVENGSVAAMRISGITIMGTDNSVERCNVSGAYGYFPLSLEAWAVLLLPTTGADARNLLIKDCYADEFHGEYACGFYVAMNANGPTYRRGDGMTINCVCKDNPGWVAFSQNSGQLIGCRSVNCGFGFRVDTGIIENLVMSGNVFVDCVLHGMQIMQDGWTGYPGIDISVPPLEPAGPFIVEGNVFTMKFPTDGRTWGSRGILLQAAVGGREFHNLQILNNVMILPEGTAAGGISEYNDRLAVAIDNAYYRDSNVEGNWSNRGLWHTLTGANAAHASFRIGNNYWGSYSADNKIRMKAPVVVGQISEPAGVAGEGQLWCGTSGGKMTLNVRFPSGASRLLATEP